MTSSETATTPAAQQAPASEIVLLATCSIRIDGGTQARSEINQATVGEYAEALAGGAAFPPVIVFFDGANHWLADGYHRWHAHNTAGKASIQAEVRNGTQRDARLYSFGANADHGLRRGNADKRKAVLAMLEDEEWGAWADRVIARTCAVSHNFVSSLRRHLSSDDRCDAEAGATDLHAAPVARTVQRGGSVYQQKVRKPSALRGPAQEPSPAAAAPTLPMPVDLSAIPENLTKAESAQLARQLRAEDPEEFDALAELEQTQAEVVHLQKQIETLTADDTKAQLHKALLGKEQALMSASDAMDRAKKSQDREKWVMRQLMRCGRLVGEDDPRNIAGRVGGVMKRLGELEAAAKALDDGSTTPPVSAQDARVPEAPPVPVMKVAPAVVAPSRASGTTMPAATVPAAVSPISAKVAALVAKSSAPHLLADDAGVIEDEEATS